MDSSNRTDNVGSLVHNLVALTTDLMRVYKSLTLSALIRLRILSSLVHTVPSVWHKETNYRAVTLWHSKFHQNNHNRPHSSSIRATYGKSFVSLRSNLCSTLVTALLYSILRNISTHYNGPQLYCGISMHHLSWLSLVAGDGKGDEDGYLLKWRCFHSNRKGDCKLYSQMSTEMAEAKGCDTLLTHWGRATQICVGKLTTIGSDNGLSPGQRQAIIWTIAGILLIWPLGTNFSEILIGIQTFLFKKMHLKMSSAKWRPFVSASMC